MVCKYFLPICSLSFHLLNRVFHKAKVFLILMKSNLSIFSFIDCAFGVISMTSLSSPRSQRFSPLKLQQHPLATPRPCQPSLPPFLTFLHSTCPMKHHIFHLFVYCLPCRQYKFHWAGIFPTLFTAVSPVPSIVLGHKVRAQYTFVERKKESWLLSCKVLGPYYQRQVLLQAVPL